MRKVKVYKNGRKEEVTGIGTFLTWGTKVIECYGDLATQTVAIVELENGSVEELYPDCMDFIEETKDSTDIIKTVRCHYNFLGDYCNKIGREHIVSITSSWGEQYGEHFFTLVYDTPDLALEDC